MKLHLSVSVKCFFTTQGFVQMDEQGLEAVRNVYKRACTIHLPKKPYIHLAWAAFEERQGKENIFILYRRQGIAFKKIYFILFYCLEPANFGGFVN